MKKLNKFWVRLSVVFLIHTLLKSFDLSFPNGPFGLSWRSLCFSLYFISYGICFWYVAERFEQFLRKKIKKPENNRWQAILYVLAHAAFAFVAMCLLNYLYRLGDFRIFNNKYTWHDVPSLNPQFTISLTSMYLIIFGIDSYWEMRNKLQDKILREEQLKRENITAHYKALKAQIEPHFLFNSLSVLSSLVYEDADLSADFIVKLSKTLRYIIEKNECNLVKLSSELKFLESYFFLIKTRLENGVFLENKLGTDFTDSAYIPPVTLQLLIENAVNHNSYNPDKPLCITIEKNGGQIIVRNTLSPRAALKESTKKGLKNISDRYELICSKKIEIKKTDTEFIVKLPILSRQDHESFNF